MKYVLISCFCLLVAASVGTNLSQPQAQSKVPVIYWVTDPNPAREEQIELFQQWMKKNGYPEVDLRLDTANRRVSKMIIQGVSGVGGDIMDIGSGSGMRYFNAIGLLSDVTEDARRLKFDPSQTYPAMESEITLDGRQYMFPCNVYIHLYWVNLATFRKHGLERPPEKWTFDEFERIGKKLVGQANTEGKRRTVFFANHVPSQTMRRSLGLSVFNETMTACALNDERYVKVLNLLHKWTYEDHLLPCAADRESFSTESGYGGSTLQLFNRGNYAMFAMGRYALIQLRKFGNLELAVSDPPYGEFPNTSAGTRSGSIYIGSKNQELARYFLAFLASEDYNQQIVKDADALPPNPKFTQTEGFLRPPDYPNEWGCHEAFSKAAKEIAIGGSYSPFVVPNTASRVIWETEDGFMSDRYPAEEAARMAAAKIDREIQLTLKENPKLRDEYDRLAKRQSQIEEHRKNNRPVPLDWIENPFHRRYYQWKGWSESAP